MDYYIVAQRLNRCGKHPYLVHACSDSDVSVIAILKYKYVAFEFTVANCYSSCKVKVKVVLYSAVSSPLDRSKRFTLFALPGRPVHSDTNSASPGSILARQQLRAKAKSLTFPPLSIARYSFIQLSQLGHQWRERKYPIFECMFTYVLFSV